jgi:hypothetical protein
MSSSGGAGCTNRGIIESFVDRVQSIVEAALPLAFSLLCPCSASLHLPQAALSSAPFFVRKRTKKNLRRGIAFLTKALPLLAFLFFRRFFSLA